MRLQDLMKYRESGELSDVTVVVEGEDFKLHKFPLYIKSDYFKEESRQAGKDRIELADFPGGATCFKLIADFCYNKQIDISLDNVAQLRCGAEYLKMVGDNNLIDLTERYLDDVLRSAQASRSLSPIVDLIGRTACLGPAAEEAKIAERCFAAVMDVWTRPGRVDALIVDRLLRLPLAWFERLAKSCAGENNERQLKPLAELSSRYLHRVFQREQQQPQKQPAKQQAPQAAEKKKEDEAKKEPEKDKDESLRTPEAAAPDAAAADAQPQPEAAEADATAAAPAAEPAAPEQQAPQEQQQQPEPAHPSEEAEQAAATSDVEADGPKPSKQQQQQQQDSQLEPKEPAGEVLDRVIVSLPEATPLAEVISGDWIRQALQVSEQYNCQCRPRLLQLAGQILHRLRQEELKQMPSPVLCDIVSSSAGTEGSDPEVLSGVIDNHLLDLARAGSLSADDFAKLAGSVPADCRASHDTLYEAAETLLTAGESIPDDKQKAVVDAVDLSRCDVATLQRALDKGAFPAKVVCQAAIDLAQRSRQQPTHQTGGVPEVKPVRRDDFKTAAYTSPTRRFRPSSGYDGVTATTGYNSYREPAYGGKYDTDFDASGSRFTVGYDATYSTEVDRSARVDFQAGSGYRNYSTRKW